MLLWWKKCSRGPFFAAFASASSATAVADAVPEEEKAQLMKDFRDETNKRLQEVSFCPLCSKHTDGSHFSSRRHHDRLSESVTLDYMLGPVTGLRSLTPSELRPFISGPGKPVCRQTCRAVWGSRMDTMAFRAKEVIKKSASSSTKDFQMNFRQEDVRPMYGFGWKRRKG
jgi:hypothetical protein